MISQCDQVNTCENWVETPSSFFHKCIERAMTVEKTPEARLFLAVIMQAINEMRSSNPSKEAERWLFEDEKGLPVMCDILGLNVEWVRNLLIEYHVYDETTLPDWLKKELLQKQKATQKELDE